MSYFDIYEDLDDHLARGWEGRRQEDYRWTLGPAIEEMPNFFVRRIDPRRNESPYVYATVGAFEVDEHAMREFFILSPVESPRHVETLAMVSHYHSFFQHRLHHGSVLDLGRPWIDGSAGHHIFVSWPYVLEEGQDICRTSMGDVTYLWLIPIFKNEAKFIKNKGAEAFGDLLEESGVDLVDPRRLSVV
ncbi:suppressor of fused domain protein [Nocardiopsis sp. NPDC057823]|uniref:suppressor of fused domain protein n=1 Tax=Nocardiopsis sp. NPDC057823 TaxID=3346256 RepID=UPI00366F3CB1